MQAIKSKSHLLQLPPASTIPAVVRNERNVSTQDNRISWYARPTTWFWSVIIIGAVIRLYLVLFTQGTSDVELWEENARGVYQLGLVNYYHAEPTANHPPAIFEFESLLCGAAIVTGLPFRILLRLPLAVVDAATMILLMTLLPSNRYRFLIAAAYWLNPLAIILSAYHGNTDCAVAFFLLLCVWWSARNKSQLAGMALGAGLWIKLSVILPIPAMFLFLQGWRKRLIFCLSLGIIAVIGYLPALVQDAAVVYTNVFGYRGLALQTVGGVPVWGPRVLFSFFGSPTTWLANWQTRIEYLSQTDWQIALVLALIFTWLRRSYRTVPGLCGTIAGIYAILYGFSDNWSFQYLAWALPFWFFLGPAFYIPAVLFNSGYIYSLYWFLCGNPWLGGRWNFDEHAYWPTWVMVFRNCSVAFFFVSGCALLSLAVRRGLKFRLVK